MKEDKISKVLKSTHNHECKCKKHPVNFNPEEYVTCSEGNITDTTNEWNKLKDIEKPAPYPINLDETKSPEEAFAKTMKYKLNKEDMKNKSMLSDDLEREKEERKMHYKSSPKESAYELMKKLQREDRMDMFVRAAKVEFDLTDDQIAEIIWQDKKEQGESFLNPSEGQSPPEIIFIIQELGSATDSLNQLSEEVFDRCLKLYPLPEEDAPRYTVEVDDDFGYLQKLLQKVSELNKIRVKFELANQILTKIVG